MKRVIAFFLCLIIISSIPVCAYAKGGENVSVKAKSAVLMDLTTGKILFAKNENQKLFPASVTKVMSLILIMEAIENGKISLNDKVSASKNAVSYGGSQIWLEEGESMSVNDLLKAVVISSANDACTALGEYVAGSSQAFVDEMNKKARALGATSTHFQNCTGLDEKEKNHLSTAADIAVMSRELMKYDLIKKYSTVWMDSLREGKTELVNTNRLVRSYDGCIGLKTGTTTKAGFCVSAVAKRENTTLCAVIMGSKTSEERFESAAALLDFGFANYETVKVEADLSQAGNIEVFMGQKDYINPVIDEQSLYITLPKGEKGKIECKTVLEKNLKAPVDKNQVVGTVEFYNSSKKVGSAYIRSKEYIGKLSFAGVFKKLLKSIVTNS